MRLFVEHFITDNLGKGEHCPDPFDKNPELVDILHSLPVHSMIEIGPKPFYLSAVMMVQSTLHCDELN